MEPKTIPHSAQSTTPPETRPPFPLPLSPLAGEEADLLPPRRRLGLESPAPCLRIICTSKQTKNTKQTAATTKKTLCSKIPMVPSPSHRRKNALSASIISHLGFLVKNLRKIHGGAADFFIFGSLNFPSSRRIFRASLDKKMFS